MEAFAANYILSPIYSDSDKNISIKMTSKNRTGTYEFSMKKRFFDGLI